MTGTATKFVLRTAITIALFLFPSHRLTAQVPTGLPIPANLSPDQAKALLQARPDLAAQLRERLAASGLTPDQVRARLRSAGYPEDLLDPYLANADTSVKVQPRRGDVEALRTLGVLATEEADSLVRFAVDSAGARRDSLQSASDTVEFIYDSLGRATPRLRIFGLSVFRQRTTQFQSSAAGPVDGNYRLGPGDQLVLLLSGDVESTTSLEVTREGFVVIPQVGQVFANNLTLSQFEDLLYTRLGRVYSGVRRSGGTTRFLVTVARLRNVQVFVAGDVLRPGSYQISATGTVLSALYAAGGPTERGSMRRVEVRRGKDLVGSLDLYDYLLRGQNGSEVRLNTGDVVFVPPRGSLVSASGAVLRPALYEITPNETLRDIIAAAGGFDARAQQTRLQIHRIQPPTARNDTRDRVVIDVSFTPAADGLPPAIPLAAGDSITAFEVRSRVRQYVTVKGAIWQEGRIGYATGMMLSEALRLGGGIKPDAYLGSVLVSRLQSDSSRIQLRATLADSTGALVKDLPLREDDEITVFSRLRLATYRYITVTGAVKKSGRLAFRDGMTMRDAVLLANGLTEDALLTEAEIARLPESRGSGSLARTIRVPLDSTYLFERAADGRYLGPPGVAAPRSGSSDVPLSPYDNVLIFRQPQWELLRQVTILGQVTYPGVYALTTRDTRISDLITRAGGLTQQAYPAGVQFYRAKDRKGRIGIDLPRVLKDPKFGDNLMLAAGDSLVIPEYNPVVTVDGAVNAPVAVAYVRGASADFYVRAAGGFSRLADKRRTYVTQPTGKLESGRARKPLPGARVFVPARDPSEPRTPLIQVVSALAGVLASLATIVIVATK